MKTISDHLSKSHNKQWIFRTIYDTKKISRAEISRMTGLTRATVSTIVTKLMKEGLVVELGQGASIGGKPPIMLSLAEDARFLIGIDLSGTELHGALVNLRGNIKHRVSVPVENCLGDAVLAKVYRLIDRLITAASSPIEGIGIGTPGLVDIQRGVVLRAANLDWNNLALGDLLKARYKLPVYISNDCKAAALGEFTFGNGHDISNLIVIKICRGTGAGLVLNRQLYFGDGFGAGEIGHITAIEGGELCSCGKRGCLETVTCSRFIVKSVQEAVRSDPLSSLHPYVSQVDESNTDGALESFPVDDPVMHSIAAQAGRYLGGVVANLVNTLNIQRIVIAGSVSRFGQALTAPIREEIQRSSLKPLAEKTTIEISKLGADIVVLGAAALLLNNGLLMQ